MARCLAPGGAFLLVDIFMREGEERAGWLGRYSENMDEAVGRGARCACCAVPAVPAVLRLLCLRLCWGRRREIVDEAEAQWFCCAAMGMLCLPSRPPTASPGTVPPPHHGRLLRGLLRPLACASQPPCPARPAAGIVEAPEAELIMDHIVNFDFPERMSTWRQLAADAGFSSCEELCVDSKQFGRLALLRKAADADAATAAASPHN